MTDSQEQWQLDAGAPELYQRYLVPAMTSMWADDLAGLADLGPGERILDVACGTGVVARVAAERVGSAGSVAGLDLNPGMLAVARSLPPVVGAPVEWHEGSALDLPFGDHDFDVVFCQLGLQFFPDRPAALREMLRVLVPEGRLALNVFGPIEHNPATHAISDSLDRRLHSGASLVKRNEHSLADPHELRRLVENAGFTDVTVETATKTVRFPSAMHYVQIQLSGTPLALVVTREAPVERERLVEEIITDVSSALAPYAGEEGLQFPQEVHRLLAFIGS
jgi:ubiquinone/menaquinone biosynthesis C-methylase UbiE